MQALGKNFFFDPEIIGNSLTFPEKCQRLPMKIDMKFFSSQTVLLRYLNDLLVHKDLFQRSLSYIQNFSKF